MPEGLSRIFSGGVSIERVNGFGIALMVAAVAVVAAAGAIAGRCPEEKRENCKILIKLCGVVLCAAGAMIAIMT